MSATYLLLAVVNLLCCFDVQYLEECGHDNDV